MDKKECYYLGKITKLFGFKGELTLFLDVDSPEDYKQLDSVFIEINKQLLPFFIDKIRFQDNKAVATFADISAEDAERLVGKELYLPLSCLPKLTGNKFYFHEVINFKVIDNERGEIGVLESVLDFPAQAIFQIKFGDKEILLPVIDSVIEKVDRENQTLYVNSPAGLIDLYLS